MTTWCPLCVDRDSTCHGGVGGGQIFLQENAEQAWEPREEFLGEGDI